MAKDFMDLNTILMRSTFKIEGDGSIGTCFILGKSNKEDKNKKYGYFVLITATHVLDEMKGEKATLFLRKKVNNSYQKVALSIPIRKEEDLWIRHPEVDVSAMYVNLPNDIDIALLSTDLLADDEIFEKYEIHPGDELMCLGYPFSQEANPAGFPILRSGKIASFPIIPSHENKHFLFDFEIYKGNSGGPVYFVQTGRPYGDKINIGGTIQFIAGLVSSEHMIEEKIETLDEERTKRYSLALAVVIHGSFIKETIELLPSLKDFLTKFGFNS